MPGLPWSLNSPAKEFTILLGAVNPLRHIYRQQYCQSLRSARLVGAGSYSPWFAPQDLQLRHSRPFHTGNASGGELLKDTRRGRGRCGVRARHPLTPFVEGGRGLGGTTTVLRCATTRTTRKNKPWASAACTNKPRTATVAASLRRPAANSWGACLATAHCAQRRQTHSVTSNTAA